MILHYVCKTKYLKKKKSNLKVNIILKKDNLNTDKASLKFEVYFKAKKV